MNPAMTMLEQHLRAIRDESKQSAGGGGGGGQQVDQKTQALIRAAEKGFISCIAMLLEAGANVDQMDPVTGLRPLHIVIKCAFSNSADIVDLLLKHQANPNCLSRAHYTPLMICAMNGDAVVAERLIEAQCFVNVRNFHSESALMIAEKEENWTVVELLKRHGALEKQ